MPLLVELSDLHGRLQGELFPVLADELGVLTARMKQFITVLEMCPIGGYLAGYPGLPGRPPGIARRWRVPCIAKAVLGIPTTLLLIERLAGDATLRRLCGWSRRDPVPSHATFSRAFAEFAQAALPSRMQEALIEATGHHRRHRPNGSALECFTCPNAKLLSMLAMPSMRVSVSFTKRS